MTGKMMSYGEICEKVEECRSGSLGTCYGIMVKVNKHRSYVLSRDVNNKNRLSTHSKFNVD